jgi:hypothetical protein
MSRRRSFCSLSLLLAAVVVGTSATPAWAIGHYNLPGSFCQCFGYGNGGGHHACLMLGPLSCEGFCATHEERLPYSPQPPYAYYGGGPCNAMGGASWLNDGVQIQQAPAPEPTPAPQAARPRVQQQRHFW